jgi:hypothetical protein
MSLVLAFPGETEVQDFKFTDKVTYSMFVNLLEDYMVDFPAERETYYSSLKSLRKQIKMYSNHETKFTEDIQVDRRFSHMKSLLKKISSKTVENHFRSSILRQTRSAGTPPLAVLIQTYEKLKATLEPEATPFTKEEKTIIVDGVYKVWNRINQTVPDLEFKVKLALNRAKVSLSDSADLNFSREESGKYEASRRLILGKTIPFVDLQTGEDTGEMIPDTPEYIGTKLFHESIREIRDSSDEVYDELTSCRAFFVTELAKFRGITISDIKHVLSLHPAAKILGEVLSHLPSEHSGFKKSNHAFEFFKRLVPENPAAAFLFEWGDVWGLSSDLERATDLTPHELVKIILTILLGPRCLGFPTFYASLCVQMLSCDRTIYYRHEQFVAKRGCLMGDPLTKQVLHLIQLLSEEIALTLLREE